MTETRTSQIGPLLITGLLAILGTVAGGVIQGYWENTLADKKFQTDLVMKALEAEEQASRIESLRFMIETNLIADPSIRQGLEDYLTRKPEAVPRIQPTASYAPGVVVPSTSETAGFTDFNVFVCSAASDSDKAKSTAAAIIDALKNDPQTGQIALKQWNLYDEIPLAELRDKLTLVVDMNHGEAKDVPRLKHLLAGVPAVPAVQVVPNRGRASPWLISLVVCPSD